MALASTRARSAAVVIAGLIVAVAAPTAGAEPVNKCNVPIEMSDGAILRANVFLPSEGPRFPTALTVTGYNKDVGNPTGGNCSTAAGLAVANAELLDAGYAIMILDDRGTGQSEGAWDSWGQRTQDDYAEVLDWIQAQPWSDGKVGTNGTSYMGITSLLVAEKDADRVAAGKPRAVEAVWANVPMADAYRDVTFHGGAVDSGFIPLWLGLTTGLSDLPPSTLVGEPGQALPVYAQHLANTFNFAGTKVIDSTLGGEAVYDGPFYRLRSPVDRIDRITVPVAWSGGWWDIFQRGEPLLYEAMTNSPERMFWMTPRYHASDDGGAWDELGIGTMDEVHRRWFDRWIKGEQNGVDRLAPVNLYTMGAKRWQHLPRWPVPGTRYTPFYLTGEKGLARAAPDKQGGDATPLLPVSSPCSRLTAQWTAGLVSGPCDTDNRTYEATALTYSTPPLDSDTEVTGLITAEVWAKLSSADATLVAVLSDVAPSGESTQVTAGFLLASQRALDGGRSTRSRTGKIVRPWHPFTRDSQVAVTPGAAERYLIEVYPTSQLFQKGHRMRLTIATANTPSTFTPTPQAVEQTGEMTLLRGPDHPSNLLLPLVEGSDVAGSRGCLARRSPIGPRNIGRIRIGFSRNRLLRRVPAPGKRLRRSWRWCVKRSNGSVRAVFSRGGRVTLVATTARSHGNRGVRPGSPIARLRRSYPGRRAVAGGIYRAGRGSPRLIGVRRGRVRFIAVASRGLLANPLALRTGLRRAGL